MTTTTTPVYTPRGGRGRRRRYDDRAEHPSSQEQWADPRGYAPPPPQPTYHHQQPSYSPEFGALLRESEGRTMRALTDMRREQREDMDDLRAEVRTAVSQFMPAQQITERWRAHDATEARQDHEIGELQRAVSQAAQVLPTLARTEDVTRVVRDLLGEFRHEYSTTAGVERLFDDRIKGLTTKFATPEDVRQIMREAHDKQFERIRNLALLTIAIISLLAANHLINLAGLFGGH